MSCKVMHMCVYACVCMWMRVCMWVLVCLYVTALQVACPALAPTPAHPAVALAAPARGFSPPPQSVIEVRYLYQVHCTGLGPVSSAS